MTACCHVAHTSSGRTRLRLSGDDNEKSRILKLATAISELDAVTRIDTRLTTGSIIIEHPEIKWSNLVDAVKELLPVDFVSAPKPERTVESGLSALNSRLQEIDAFLKQSNAGELDLRTLTFLMLVSLAIVQAARGQVMVSAASLLWYALSVASREKKNSQAVNPEDVPEHSE